MSEDGIEQAVERYKRYLENRGFRPTTIRVYSANLRSMTQIIVLNSTITLNM